MAENNYDLEYTGSMVDRILDTGYDLQNQGYIFRGLASHYTGTPTERTWLIAPTGSTGFGLSSPVPPGSIGICMYNGSSWYAEVLNTLTLDTAPTTGSGNGITSGAVKTLAESITNAIGQLEQSVSDRFTSLELEDTTGSLQAEVLSITLKYVFEGETESLTSISILAATAEKAGLMSAADKQKLDAFVTNIRSLRIQDTTVQADQGTEITNTLKWTIEGVTEAITAFTLYAATTSKAGLMSAADKTALDTLPSLINAGYLYAGIATPSTVPSSTDAKIFYIAIEGGTYTSFGNLNVTQGINIIYKSGNAWSVAQVVGIDNEPTAGSDNLVKSGGVKTELALGAVYDVSAHNNGATFESLSALLSDTDLNALIPTAVRKGGMSIKFVQSSDNKYVQFRLMKNQWSTTPSDWQGTDTIPMHNSHNTIESGGVESEIFSAHTRGMLLSEVKTKASGTGDIAKNATTVGMVLEESNTYILTLAQAASLSALYCYIMKNGETVKGITMTVGKNYIISDIDADSVAFYSVSAGTANGEIELDVRNFTYGLEKIISSDIASRVLVSKILAYEGFSGTRAVDANIKRGQRFRLITKAYDSASGKITLYAKNGSDTLWTQTLDTVNNDIELCLDENITSIEYWINSTNVTAEGLFVLAVSLDDGNVQFDRNKVNALMHLDISENVNYSGNIAEEPTRHQVGYNKGDKIRVAITSKDYSEGMFYVYLKDKNGSIVYSSNLGVNSTTDIVVPADLGTISWYVNGAQIVIPGIVNISVYKLSSVDTIGVSDNLLYGPYKEVKVSGTTGYVHEDALNVSCQEGDVFFVGFEKVIGNLSVPIVCYFKDENNVNVNVVYVGFPQEIKAPAGTKSLVVRLYPNQTGTAQDITAVYYNIYVAEGTKAKKYIYEDTTPIYAPNDYYHEDNYLNDKVARINELLKVNYGYGDAFIFITDTHWMRYNAKQSPSLIRYIRERTNITKLIGGGDFEDQGATDGGGYNMFRLLTDNFKEKDTHVVIGNHEFLGSTTNSQIANLYNKIAKHQDIYNGSLLRWYYFYDDNFRKIRYIFLASYDESERVKQDDPTKSDTATNGYDSTQLTWLENTALANVPNGYDIIVIAHGGMNIMQSPDHNEEVNWSNEHPVAEILDSYKSAHPNCHILNIRGHAHRDRIAYTEGGLPFVLVTCDKNVPWPTESQREDPSSPYYNWYPDLNVDRTSETIHEQAFDVMILNTHTHTLTAVRIGGKARDGVGNDPGQEVEERTVNY